MSWTYFGLLKYSVVCILSLHFRGKFFFLLADIDSWQNEKKEDLKIGLSIESNWKLNERLNNI